MTCYPHNRKLGYSSDVGSQSHSRTKISPSKCDSSDSSPTQHSTPRLLSPLTQIYVHTQHGHSSEAWLLTPPPRFTAGNHEAPRVDITDLENLLIEHPSMSVYKRSGSEGEESNMSESSSNELVPAKSKRSQAMSRQAPKRARAVSARAQVLAQVSQVKHAQKLQQKQSSKKQSKKNLERANKSAIKDKHVTRKNKVRNPSGRMNGRIPQRKQ